MTSPMDGLPGLRQCRAFAARDRWVGEAPRAIASVYEALAHCRLFLATAPLMPPNRHPGSPRPQARPAPAGSRSPDPTANPGPFDDHIAGPLAETVPAHVKRLIAERRFASAATMSKIKISPPRRSLRAASTVTKVQYARFSLAQSHRKRRPCFRIAGNSRRT